MISKHTPTPWIYEQSEDGFKLKGNAGYFYNIAAVWDINGSSQNEANASFIVRACNAYHTMLAALNEAREELYHSTHSSGDPSDPTNMQSDAIAYRKVVAAIEFAEAKS